MSTDEIPGRSPELGGFEFSYGQSLGENGSFGERTDAEISEVDGIGPKDSSGHSDDVASKGSEVVSVMVVSDYYSNPYEFRTPEHACEFQLRVVNDPVFAAKVIEICRAFNPETDHLIGVGYAEGARKIGNRWYGGRSVGPHYAQ